MNLNQFAKTLRDLRMHRGLKQYELAEEIKVTPMTISHYETGLREPNISKLIQLSDLFEVTIDELIFGDCNELCDL